MKKPKSITIHLEFPISVSGVETDKLELRRPKAGDLETVETEKNEQAMQRKLIINLLQITDQEYRSIDLADLKKISDEVTGFFC